MNRIRVDQVSRQRRHLILANPICPVMHQGGGHILRNHNTIVDAVEEKNSGSADNPLVSQWRRVARVEVGINALRTMALRAIGIKI